MTRVVTERLDVIPLLAEVFREHGFEGASLAIITDRTGLGKGSLYHFFPGGKEEMVAAVLADISAWFETNVFAALADPSDPKSAIVGMLDSTDAYFQSGSRVCLVGALAIDHVRDRFPDAIKDYFARWLSALVSFALYPIVVAGVFATITGVSSALIGELGDPEGASNIGALIPFFMMVLMAKGFIIATPFIVRAISGNIMMPALSGGLGGGYSFARAAMGSQQAYNRYLIGGASGAEYAALRARQFFGVQQMPVRQGMGQTGSAAGTGSADSGSKMLAQLARLGRLGRR